MSLYLLTISIFLIGIDGNSDKVLVTTGWPSSTLSQVIDFESESCSDLAEFPYEVSGATGGLLNHKYPVICGGHSTNSSFDTCQVLGSNVSMKMIHQRDYSASVVLNNEILWVTGGTGNNLERSEQSERSDYIPAHVSELVQIDPLLQFLIFF